MESYSELPLFKAPAYVLTTDRTGKASAYRPDASQELVQKWADSLNYAVDSFDASNRSLPYPPRNISSIRHSDEFHSLFHNYLHEMHEAVLRTIPPTKAGKESKAQATTREEAEAAYHANLLHHLDTLETQRNILSRALVYTKLQKQRLPGGRVKLRLAGAPGKAVHDGAWELFETYIADTKAKLEKSPPTEARRHDLDQRRKKILAIALLALGGLALIGLLVALTHSFANQPVAPEPLPLQNAYPPQHHHRPAPQPQRPNPPPMGPQPAINPILLGYNPGIQEYLSIQTPFTPSPLYSYPA
jgi:hypothetical protein